MNPARTPRAAARGFSLIELLVSVGIVLILAGLVVPGLVYARARAREGTCTAQLRQLGHGFEMYLADYDLHRPSYLHQLHPQYVTDRRLFVCPSDAWADRGGWAWAAWGKFSTPPRPWPFAVSYGYFWLPTPGNTRFEKDWVAAKQTSGQAGYAVCVLHGNPCSPLEEGAAPFYQGLTLRLTFSGAVSRRQIQYEPGRGCFSVPRLRTG